MKETREMCWVGRPCVGGASVLIYSRTPPKLKQMVEPKTPRRIQGVCSFSPRPWQKPWEGWKYLIFKSLTGEHKQNNPLCCINRNDSGVIFKYLPLKHFFFFWGLEKRTKNSNVIMFGMRCLVLSPFPSLSWPFLFLFLSCSCRCGVCVSVTS